MIFYYLKENNYKKILYQQMLL